MLKKINLLSFILFLLPFLSLMAQIDLKQDAHKWVTFQAWNLLRYYNHPEIQNSEMDLKMGHFTDPNPDVDFVNGKVVAGSYREDETDLVYHISSPVCLQLHTSTHFWDADLGDEQLFEIAECTFHNSFHKITRLWNGDYDLIIKIVGTPVGYSYGTWFLHCKYLGNLSDAYKNHNIIVYSLNNITGQSYNVNPPRKLYQFFSNLNSGREFTRKICWEIVGRICHLIEDSGVPAHAHDDPHGTSDYYEDEWMPQHFKERDWEDAKNSGGMIEINNKTCPLKFALYTTNQIADRFPSDDKDGDYYFATNDCGDNYSQILQPIYNNINVSTEHFNGNPPPELMYSILNNAYVYSIRSVAGFLWYVYTQFQIVSNVPPIILSISQTGILSPSTLSIFTCNLAQNSGTVNNYSWSLTNETNHNIVINNATGNQVTLQWLTDNKIKKGPDKNIYLSCTAYGIGNSTKTVKVIFQLYPQNGCPWLLLSSEEENYTFENNILHKSTLPEFRNQDITDRYILKTKPTITNNIIKFKLFETNTDFSLINKIKLFFVHHPVGTKLGILEDQTLITYDSINVIQTTNASLYDPYYNYKNITEPIQYHNQHKGSTQTLGDSLYHIYAEFRNQEIINPSIIAFIKNKFSIYPIISKDYYSAELFVNTPTNSLSYSFSRRENPDEVIIPITELGQSNSVDSIHIAW